MTEAARRRPLALASLAVLFLLLGAAIRHAVAETPFRRGVNIADYLSVHWFPPGTQPGEGAFWYAPAEATVAADLARVRRLGFDFVRLVVDGGALAALEAGPRPAALAAMARIAARVPEAGLGLVLALNFPDISAGVQLRISGARILSEPEAAARFLALAGEVARALAPLPAERVAIEPLAEPPACVREAVGWTELQERALERIEASGFAGWRVVSPACFAGLGAFLGFDVRGAAAPRTLVTFHFYEPYLFTHQGHSGFAPFTTYLEGLPFPNDAARSGAALSAALGRLAADRELPEVERETRRRALVGEAGLYRATGADEGFIRARFAAAAAYARALGLSPGQVLVGEFGVSVGRAGGRRGADPADRARYVGAVRRAAEEAGFAWAFWHLWGGFGLSSGRGEPCMDGAALEALGLLPECPDPRR